MAQYVSRGLNSKIDKGKHKLGKSKYASWWIGRGRYIVAARQFCEQYGKYLAKKRWQQTFSGNQVSRHYHNHRSTVSSVHSEIVVVTWPPYSQCTIACTILAHMSCRYIWGLFNENNDKLSTYYGIMQRRAQKTYCFMLVFHYSDAWYCQVVHFIVE